MSRRIRVFCLVLTCLTVSGKAGAVSQDEEELARLYGDAEFITLATGSRQTMTRAPAVANVITGDDIKAMGATDLDQVLASVPGFHTTFEAGGLNSIYVVRGIYSNTNPQILVLINGIPITNLFAGNRSQGWGGMPVHNIARIEVIRGPGSALYGADAFSGTINIVTKTAMDIRGTQMGARSGSFKTGELWLQHGSQWGSFEGAFSLEWKSTEGHRETVAYDMQSGLDASFRTSASLAPGPINASRDALEARLDMARGAWRLRAGYQGRRNIGTGAGAAQALDPEGNTSSDRFNADITYDKPNFFSDWDVTAQLSYFDVSTESDLTLFPPGAAFYTGTFAQGVIGNPYVYERHTRFSTAAVYNGMERHRIRLGTGVNYGDLYRAKESKNFDLDPNAVPVPSGAVVDVSNDPTREFIRPHDRTVVYALAQDEWSFAPDWNLTAGVRHDAYSDFGGTTNPRLALVWQTSFTLTSKLLYGRAFRAPAFAELYNINNPVALGNPDLKPETIDTLELAFDYQPADALRTRLNIFRYEMADIIRFAADPASPANKKARNEGGQDGHGLEWEARWNAMRTLEFKANYAWQHSIDETGARVANVPRHQFYAQTDWRFLPDWNVNAQVKRIMDRERAVGDSRPAIADYTVVNMTLRRKNVMNDWDIGLLVHNLLDEDVREPSPAPGAIRNDLPMPGRAMYLEFRYGIASL